MLNADIEGFLEKIIDATTPKETRLYSRGVATACYYTKAPCASMLITQSQPVAMFMSRQT